MTVIDKETLAFYDREAARLVDGAQNSDPVVEEVARLVAAACEFAVDGSDSARDQTNYAVSAIVERLCRRAGLQPVPSFLVVTNASDRYDGFGTVTVELLPWRTKGYPDRRYRLVRILEDARAWQLTRYASGMCYRGTPEEFSAMASQPGVFNLERVAETAAV